MSINKTQSKEGEKEIRWAFRSSTYLMTGPDTEITHSSVYSTNNDGAAIMRRLMRTRGVADTIPQDAKGEDVSSRALQG